MAKNGLTSMTVSLPAAQKEYVRVQSVASGCSTPSEYIRRLIHADQRTREQDRLEMMILEGLRSPAREMTRKDWREFRAELRRKAATKRKPR
jgi:hypothetical protein